MAPLFGESEDMKQIGQQMQNLSEQIGTLRQQLAQKTTEVENLQKQLGGTQNTSNTADPAALQRAQNEISSLRQQLDMLQAQAKQATATSGGATTSSVGGATTSSVGSAVSSAMGAGAGAGSAGTHGLSVGSNAWVTRAGGLPLRMRSAPSLNGDILDRLAPGTQMTLLSGPQDSDGHAWWHIRTSSGHEGWVAGEDLRSEPD